MSTRPQLKPAPVIINGDMSTNIISAATILSNLSMINYAFNWTGSSPIGTIAVECSNDYSLFPNGAVNNAGTWTIMTIQYQGIPVQSVPVSGNTGNGSIDIQLTAAYATRVIYTAGSGTGTLNSIVNLKVT